LLQQSGQRQPARSTSNDGDILAGNRTHECVLGNFVHNRALGHSI
jgi:hypothetical protein